MAHLRIFCDVRMSEDDRKVLEAGVAPHELIVPQHLAESVLAAPGSDPLLAEAEIIVGQPGVDEVLGSKILRWLHVTSAGFTRYDTPEFRAAAQARELVVTNSSDVYAEACADHVFAFMLAEARKLPQALASRSSGGSPEWVALRNTSVRLRMQEVVILGFGAIASRLVELLGPFHMKITAMRRRPTGAEGVTIVGPEEIADALASADHVVNILPENPDSVHFISATRLRGMKPGAIFYNIGRGRTVDQQALADSLTSGHLGAAWLDVTDPEPLPTDHPLWVAPRCYITPHIAGGHANESATLVRHFLGNFKRYLHGSDLQDRIM